MIAFWVVAGVLAAATAGLMLVRARQAAGATFVDPTREVYRRQLAEIDELADRGLIGEPERKSAHAEAARRLLNAGEGSQAPWSTDETAARAVFLAALAAPAAALGLYVIVGQPGMADQPFAKRLAAWRSSDPASLGRSELVAVMTRVAREHPQDAQAWRFLALAQGAAQDPSAAVRALRHATDLSPRDAELWELLGEAEVAAGDGSVSPQAEQAFRRALAMNPNAAAPRFHLARLQIARGDKAGGLAAWRALLADLPATDPRRAELSDAIAKAEGRGPPPPATAGEQAMIQGMVQSLAARLAANPDDPQGWVRLVRAYAVMGDKAKRDAALTQARSRYAARPDILAQLDAAARAEPMQ